MARELRKITQEELEKILVDHKLWYESKFTDNPKRIGKKADLSYTDLSGINLTNVNLYQANLYGASLEKAILREANLSYTDLREANLREANFIGANLEVAMLSQAVCIATNFNGANLSGADLDNSNLDGSNLFKTTLRGANADKADIRNADARFAFITNANFKRTDLRRTKFSSTDFKDTLLDGALYDVEELKNALNVNPKYLSQINIILDTESQIQSLEEEKKELQEKLSQASSSSQEEKEIFEQQILDLEKKLEEVEEIKAQEQTKQQIEGTVKYLKSPNSYIKNQIRIQYFLTILYIGLCIMTVWFFVHYIDDNYTNFKLNMDSETTFINWLFYASPLLISFSLIIVLINQINARLQSIVNHNERKRQVDSIEGSLLAINVLSINNEEARKTILNTMEKIINHAFQNNGIALDEKAIEDPLSTLSKIKDLVK